MLPHLLAGPAIIAASAYEAAVLNIGTTVPATVTKLEINLDSEGANSYQVSYDYFFDNQKYHALGCTNKFKYDELKVGGPISVKAMAPFPNLGQLLLDGNLHWPAIAFMFCFGVVWSLLMFIPGYEVFIAPDRRTKVMTNGKIFTGRIVDKLVTGEDKDHFALSFQFEPVSGQYRTDRVDVTNAQFTAAEVGEPVTVLYDSAHPGHSLIYRYSDYELVA